MSVSNSAEAVVGIMMLIDQVGSKMDGARLGAIPWRPASPGAADELAALAHEALQRCDDATAAEIVVTVAAMTLVFWRFQKIPASSSSTRERPLRVAAVEDDEGGAK